MGIASLCKQDSSIIIEDGQKADLLNSHFVSVGTIDDGILPPFNVAARSGTVSLSSIYLNTEDILDIVRPLNVTS